MRKDWKQVVGEKHLFDMLHIAKPGLVRSGYDGCLLYKYQYATYKKRPSYELVIKYNEDEILAVVYIIDSRFSDSIRNEEMRRIQHVLASHAVAVITALGLVHLIDLSCDVGEVTEVVMTETEDKDFLPLQ